jgi:serralysin
VASYIFQTITAAQALAFNAKTDSVQASTQGRMSSFGVSFDEAAQQVTISDPESGRVVTFGAGMFGGRIGAAGGDSLQIGSPGADYVRGAGAVHLGSGADTVFGGGDVWGDGGNDLFVTDYANTISAIRDFGPGDQLYMSAIAPTSANYVEVTRPYAGFAPYFFSEESFAKEQIRAGATYVVLAVGPNLQIYSDTLGQHNGLGLGQTILFGKTLDDISPTTFRSGPPLLGPGLPTEPPPSATPPGGNGLIIGNMDTLHLSRLLGASIDAATSSGLVLKSATDMLNLSGSGLTYDANQQLTGGTITQIGFVSTDFHINLAVHNVSASSFGAWVAADATSVAFSTILAANDTIGGGTQSDLLRGYAGDDLIYGVGGADSLFGGEGNDQIYAIYPPNMTGGTAPGATYLRGEEGNDILGGGAQFDDINGNAGADTAHGNDGDDWVVGGKDADLLFGDNGFDIVYGNLGDDTVSGGDGADWVRGGQGAAGDDLIWGDRGDDTVSGGAGADTFHSFSGAGLDRIIDFSLAEGDRVQLDPGTAYTTKQIGADTVVDMGNGDQVILVGVQLSSLTGNWVIVG